MPRIRGTFGFGSVSTAARRGKEKALKVPKSGNACPVSLAGFRQRHANVRCGELLAMAAASRSSPERFAVANSFPVDVLGEESSMPVVEVDKV